MNSLYLPFGKRCLDLVCTVPGLLVLSPVMLGVAVWVKLDSRGSVLFVHERVGKNMQPIGVYKFRTMVQDAASKGPAVTKGGDNRITRAGRVLRKYKLDELPQLINVLQGRMSLVGPRPEVRKYVECYSERYRTILQVVQPGITDFAAIAYRNEEEILAAAGDTEYAYIHEILPAKMSYYEQYVREVGLLTDLRLILQTLKAILG